MKFLTNQETAIVIKFGCEEHLKKLQQGDLYVCPLKKYVEDEKLKPGIFDKSEGVSKYGKTICINMGKTTKTLTFKSSLDYPIFCLFKPNYNIYNDVYKINYKKDIFPGYSHALVMDANKLYEKISKSCGNKYTFAYHDAVYGKSSGLIMAPFQKNEKFKEQNEIRYAFFDLDKCRDKNSEGVDVYGAPTIDINGEVLLNIEDLREISKLVRKEELDGMEFRIDWKFKFTI